MISIESEQERFFPQWLAIKDARRDRIEQEADLISPELSIRLGRECKDVLDSCIAAVQQAVETSNAILAKDRWRPFPCIGIYGWERPERTGAGCELLQDVEVEYKDPRLIISREGRPVVTRTLPRWSPKYHKPKCKGITIETYVESVAFDPGTGLFVISLRFVGPEGNFECSTPRWDFHPIRLPMFRRGAGHEDGGAPGPAPERDGGGP